MLMDKLLRNNVSSRYIEASNRMRSKQDRRRIIVYVESYDDIFFWRSILVDFEDDTRYFKVMLPSQSQHLERGKKAALMNLLANSVGRDMIACVDADYDYLIQGATPTSKIVINNPFVFHTYAYAIENLQCYAPSLYETCVMVTLNDERIFDMEDYLKKYSEIVFPLFVWSIWFYRTPNYNQFTIFEFLHIIETAHFTMNGSDEILSRLKKKVSKRIDQFQAQFPHSKGSYLQVKDDIMGLGVTPENTYLFIQGHHLFDKIVLPMMDTICSQLVRNRENEIARQSVHGTQRNNELSCYRNSIEDIISMLKKNTYYKSSDIVKKIQNDLKHFFEKYGQKQVSLAEDQRKPA